MRPDIRLILLAPQLAKGQGALTLVALVRKRQAEAQEAQKHTEMDHFREKSSSRFKRDRRLLRVLKEALSPKRCSKACGRREVDLFHKQVMNVRTKNRDLNLQL